MCVIGSALFAFWAPPHPTLSPSGGEGLVGPYVSFSEGEGTGPPLSLGEGEGRVRVGVR